MKATDIQDFEFIIVGDTNSTIIYDLINDLNSVQKEYKFDYKDKLIKYPDSYVQNEIMDSEHLEKYLKQKVNSYNKSSFKIFICDCQFEEDLFSSFGLSIAIISTYYWKDLKMWAIKDRICFTLIDIIINLSIDIKFHYDNIGCPSDYCAYGDMDLGIEKAQYCPVCQKQISKAIRKGDLPLRQYVALNRILDYIGKRKFCFVLMPFNERFNGVFFGSIQPILSKYEWSVERSDLIHQDKEVISIIYENILRSELIIADLTDKNANVFYELGYSHAENKNVILIAQSIEDIPFDLKSWQCIKYENSPKGLTSLMYEIEKYLT